MRLNILAFAIATQAEESGTPKKVHVGVRVHHQKHNVL
jgi:hypothetical protein